jgi:hypothetical protein
LNGKDIALEQVLAIIARLDWGERHGVFRFLENLDGSADALTLSSLGSKAC